MPGAAHYLAVGQVKAIHAGQPISMSPAQLCPHYLAQGLVDGVLHGLGTESGRRLFQQCLVEVYKSLTQAPSIYATPPNRYTEKAASDEMSPGS